MTDKNERYTRPEQIEFARAVLGGEIGLDPCADPERRVRALQSFTKEENGLAVPWHGFRSVFVNPPYSGGAIETWVAAGVNQLHEARVCGLEHRQLWLVPSATATQWSQVLVREAVAVFEQSGRLHFLGPDYGPVLNPKTGKRSSPDFTTRWVLLATPDDAGAALADLRGAVERFAVDGNILVSDEFLIDRIGALCRGS